MIWRGSLQGAYRLAVVAELTVVVVLDDEAAAGARPLDQRSAPRGVERSADRVLVRGRDDDRAYVWQRTLDEQFGARSPLIDRQGGDVQPASTDHLAVHGRTAGILHRYRRHTAAMKHACE